MIFAIMLFINMIIMIITKVVGIKNIIEHE